MALPKKKEEVEEIDLSIPKDNLEIETSKLIETALLQKKEDTKPIEKPIEKAEQKLEQKPEQQKTAQVQKESPKSKEGSEKTVNLKNVDTKGASTKSTASTTLKDTEKTDPAIKINEVNQITNPQKKLSKINLPNSPVTEIILSLLSLFVGKKDFAQDRPEDQFKLPRWAKVSAATLVLISGLYCYTVYREYNRGPYGVWKTILKSWKSGDYGVIRSLMEVSIEDTPVILIERYPNLIEKEAERLGSLLARAHKLRLAAYENEFKKGFASLFWEFAPIEAIDMGDRVELIYGRSQERITFVFEKKLDEWKLVEIDGSKSKGTFEINEAKLLGAEP